MWGIGIKKYKEVNTQILMINPEFAEQDNIFTIYFVIFGLKFRIFERKYKSTMNLDKIQNNGVGFNK